MKKISNGLCSFQHSSRPQLTMAWTMLLYGRCLCHTEASWIATCLLSNSTAIQTCFCHVASACIKTETLCCCGHDGFAAPEIYHGLCSSAAFGQALQAVELAEFCLVGYDQGTAVHQSCQRFCNAAQIDAIYIYKPSLIPSESLDRPVKLQALVGTSIPLGHESCSL